MSVSVRVGNIITEIGSPSFFHAFFSTVSHRLEPKGWGSRFPEIMNGLYQGKLPAAKCANALKEIQIIKKELKSFAPSQVVWNIEDLQARPPWGDNISPHISDLSNYFVTSNGLDLLNSLIEVFDIASEKNLDVTIE